MDLPAPLAALGLRPNRRREGKEKAPGQARQSREEWGDEAARWDRHSQEGEEDNIFTYWFLRLEESWIIL